MATKRNTRVGPPPAPKPYIKIVLDDEESDYTPDKLADELATFLEQAQVSCEVTVVRGQS